MEIREYTIYNETEVLNLYSSVGWTAYTDHPHSLKRGFENSLLILGAYTDNRLVGILRAVGDGETVVFIQDILVNPQYQRQGIGTALIKQTMSRYRHVRQLQLCTDLTEKTKAFYRSCGFRELSEIGCCGFMRI